MGIVSVPRAPRGCRVLTASFYDTLAIFHGFIAFPSITTPSPLLFTAITAAAAKRAAGRVKTDPSRWEKLYRRALSRYLFETQERRSWDDVVGLGIARTWFWKADATTSAIVHGAFVATLSPLSADARSRRVWDFLQVSGVCK